MTSTEQIINDAARGIENAKSLSQWARENPWIDQAKLSFVVPSCKIIEFHHQSKVIVAKVVGADGWKQNLVGGYIEKWLECGITLRIMGQRGSFDVSASEMLKEVI